MGEADMTGEAKTTALIPGFIVACARCGSQQVRWADSRDFSPDNGPYGSLDLVCLGCRNRTEVTRDGAWPELER
jgi:hypothetical protein